MQKAAMADVQPRESTDEEFSEGKPTEDDEWVDDISSVNELLIVF